ncbi:MAG TPA: DUF167 domain-containing protein [Candidatus Sulfotelmatobacter sp.]|nr:DUF167 domain-containing protein [Candidatus Sulfotelmatobacter sp.]
MAEVRFDVRLTPRGGSDRVDGVGDDGVLLVRVAAPPADGAANAALMGLLARELGIPRSRVRVARGITSRRKAIAVADAGADEVRARWPGLAVSTPARVGGGRP